jgi:ATP-binding cassette subfamily B protein
VSDRPAAKASKTKKTRAAAALDKFHEEARLDDTYDASMLLRLWPFVRPQRVALFGSLSILILSSLLGLVRPLVMRWAFDAFAKADPGPVLFEAGLVVTILSVIEQSLTFPQAYLMQLTGARSMAALRVHVFKFLHTRALGFFDRTPVGRLVTRVTNDVDAINEMFASGALNAVGDLLRLVFIVCVMLYLDYQLSIVAFAAVPVVALFVNWTRRRIRDAYRAVRTKTARMNAYLNEQISGIGVVQAYAREDRAAIEFDEINSGYREANNRSILFESALDAAIEMISSVCIAALLWYTGYRTLHIKTSFGTVFAFVQYIDMFFSPIRDLSARFTLLQSAMSGAERVFELLGNEEEDAKPSQAEPTPKDREDLAFELDHVTFEYKLDAPVLRDVSIRAKKGEKIALVGATGAGKSTVASVLLRLYEAKSGCVRVFGKDVRSTPRNELRRHFAVVPQDVFLFPGSVASNIAAGDIEPDRERVKQALRRIDALDLFERREGGLDAPVLERGGNFSAGERQLIAFARALYRDPPVLILDEATANVDSDTEARLQRALDAAMTGRTALIIAHRLSTIRSVDRIVVFHKGRVVEEGSHDELMVHNGVYAKLYRLQFEKEQRSRGSATLTPPPVASA